MAERRVLVPVQGTWARQLPAGVDGLVVSRGGGARFHRPGEEAIYLADTDETAWAEWYRWLAEEAQQPADDVPRRVFRIAVDLDRVVDLRTAAGRSSYGLPQRIRPTRAQWPAFQAFAATARAGGANGVLYSSAARARSVCLCVFETGLSRLRVEGEPMTVIAAPPPPRGLRA